MLETIQTRLQAAFLPARLEVIDDSHKHVGHAGSKGGAGHFTVKIQSARFAGLSRVEIHRQIYQVLADLIPEKIHALCIRSNGYQVSRGQVQKLV